MKTAYLEPSAVNWYVDSDVGGGTVGAALRTAGWQPAVGMHTIYELARTFLERERQARGQALFAFVEDLDPTVSPGSANLILQELNQLRTGAAVLPFLDHLDHVATRLEIARLARGVFDHRARTFIEQRERRVAAVHPALMGRCIADVAMVRGTDPDAVPSLPRFDDAVAFFQPDVASMILRLVPSPLSVREATTLSERLADFPAIRANVRGNLYLTWICIRHAAIPALDKADDYRQVIEASYCDLFVTNDEQLKRTTPYIQPTLEALGPEALGTVSDTAG